MTTRAALFAAGLLLAAVAASAQPVRTERGACDLVKARVAAIGLAARSIAYCDIIPRESSPPGLYVLALHSDRRCAGICSTNMGWFAVDRETGRVFHWDVAGDRLGRPIRTRR